MNFRCLLSGIYLSLTSIRSENPKLARSIAIPQICMFASLLLYSFVLYNVTMSKNDGTPAAFIINLKSQVIPIFVDTSLIIVD